MWKLEVEELLANVKLAIQFIDSWRGKKESDTAGSLFSLNRSCESILKKKDNVGEGTNGYDMSINKINLGIRGKFVFIRAA